ncbi:LuxR C-terminal-related transcriptional regulator [Amycolatopsis sp. cg5]|uniref:LuxR C-terminal-related transcriptional regulator n=1 Tax=Amycolatopsis sp. cg5 TaxID=3238802 RepID=UPI003526372E
MTNPFEDSGPRVRTLLAEHDPISGHFVEGVLSAGQGLSVVAVVDSHRPIADWPLRQTDVVVLGLGHGDFLLGVVRDLAGRGVPVLVLGMDWTRRGLDNALAAGASGCLVKNTELDGVVSGVHAVAAGNRVLSPELLELYVPRAESSPRAEVVGKLSDREREVLTLLGQGMSTAEAAKLCGVSNATIKSHVSHALTKLGARNRLEAVLMIRDSFIPARRPAV